MAGKILWPPIFSIVGPTIVWFFKLGGRRMAEAMLTNFDSLCAVLVGLNDDQLHPELCENQDLRWELMATTISPTANLGAFI